MASKDVSIEILQKGQDARKGDQLLCNSGFDNATCWELGSDWTISGGKAIKASGGTGAALFLKNPYNFIEGRGYSISVRFKSYNRNGNVLIAGQGLNGANVLLFDSTTICNGCAGNTTQLVTVTKNWVQGPTNLTKLRFYADSTVSIEITSISLFETIAPLDKVLGRLDATTTDNFPLALTFAVNDPKDINARKGAYSKTFNIPATKNNNKILKHFNIANSNNLNAMLRQKLPCRILVGNLFSLVGLIQIKGVERLNDKPIFYSCIFLGNNLAWGDALAGKYLSDLQLDNSTNLKLTAKNIIKSWQADNCESTTTRGGTTSVNTIPVVYPVATYGYTNQTGFNYGSSMQLSRETWEEDYMDNIPYNISQVGLAITETTYKAPVNDWRPMVWIYNMIHGIFKSVGYKISSNFMETPEFKKLLYATPNFVYNNADQRWQANSFIGNFRDETCGGAVPTVTDLLFHDRTETCTGVGFPDNSGTHQTATPITISNAIQLQGGCASCTSNDCGSGRFQPATGAIVNSGGLLQQDLTISLSGLGTNPSPHFSDFLVAEAGYYDITTENIMFYLNIGAGAPTWTGGGDFTSNTSPTGIVAMHGGLRVQCDPVPSLSAWGDRETVDTSDQDLNGGNFLKAKDSHSFGGTLDKHTYTGYFNKGDRIRLVFQVMLVMNVKTPSTNFTTGTTSCDIQLELIGTGYNNWTASSGKVSIELAQKSIPVFGGEYNLQDVLPDNQKQLDFVKGVAHSFNLQFDTEEASKTVFIEPFSDFYLPPKDAIDWTWKLARNKSDNQSFIDGDFSRRMVFKYQTDDNDWRVNWMSWVYFQEIGDNYPHILDLGDLYPAGEAIFENPFFAGTYDSQGMQIGNFQSPGTNFYAAGLWTAQYDYSAKGIDYLPRMLYYNKMAMPVDHAPLWQGFNVESRGTTNYRFTDRRVQVADVTTSSQGYYSGANLTNSFYTSATFNNRHDFTNQFGLSYGNYWAKDYDAATNTYNAVGNQVGVGLYSRYYQQMITGLLNDPKVRECYIDLKITDITMLSFRKMVYIDGVYYRLIKVVDYQPHLNIPTKVVLHQWSPGKGSALPTAGVWINNTNGGGTIDPNQTEPVPIDNA